MAILKKVLFGFIILLVLTFLFFSLFGLYFLEKIQDHTLRYQELNGDVNYWIIYTKNKVFNTFFNYDLFFPFLKLFNAEDPRDGNLPIFNLKFSLNDISHFDALSEKAVSLGYMPDDENKWRDAKLKIDNVNYDVQIKLHGDTPPHWSSKRKSFRIRLQNSSINNLTDFNLILFDDRLLKGSFAKLLTNSFGLFGIRDDIAVLQINGIYQGIYYLEESLNTNDFFENNNCFNCLILKDTDNWIQDHSYLEDRGAYGLNPFGSHNTFVNYEISNLDSNSALLDAKKLNGIYLQFINSVESGEPLSNYFDLDYLSSFEAFRVLIGDSHFVTGDNLRIVYNLDSKKFYFMPRIEGFGNLVLMGKGGFESNLNRYDQKELDLFSVLARDPELRFLRNKKLYNFVTNNNFYEKSNQLIDLYLPYIYFDSSSRSYEFEIRDDQKIILNNMIKVKEALEYSTVYINVILNGSDVTVEIIPDSLSELSFSKFNIGNYNGDVTLNNRTISIKDGDLTPLFEGLYFTYGLDEDFNPMKKKYSFNLAFNDKFNLSDVKVDMKSEITGKILLSDDVYIGIADLNGGLEK